ncbi:MAG: hypothetical protein D6785_08560 [Planctomycetota bacterium]|nr:MAG: hypothetical protein D6785_08560 [Planctomycetota bacterium]
MWKNIGLFLVFSLLFHQSLLASSKEDLKKYEQAIYKGLKYLSKAQNKNGSFGTFPNAKEQGDVGITAVVLMAFGKAPHSFRKEFKDTIQGAVQYLLKYQQKDGGIYNPGRGLTNYHTATSLIALCYLDREKYKDAIKKAKEFLVKTQFSESYQNVKPDNLHYGGWDYKPKKGGLNADMSNVQFALEALHEAGLDPKSPVWQRAVKFLSRCQNRSESNDMKGFHILNDGGFMYYPGNSKAKPIKMKDGKMAYPSYASMTYAGLKSFIYAQVDKKDPRVQAAFNWIRKHYTLEENYGLGSRKNPKGGQQGLYYYYNTFAKALDAWGEKYIVTADGKKHFWAKELADKLVSLQKPEGYWVNENKRWWEGYPVLTTAYAVRALSVCLENMKKK